MAEITTELPYEIALDRIGPAWQNHHIVASEGQREALASRFGIVSIKKLDAEIRARRIRAGRYIEVEGTIIADVVQSCVVSLEPVEARVETEFRELYGPIGGERIDHGVEILVDTESPEPIDGPTVDVGEAVAQHLALALEPYPRIPGAVAPGVISAPEGDEPEPPEPSRPSPFAALGTLKPRQ